MKDTASMASEILRLRRPQIFPIEGPPQNICVPIFDKTEKIKSRRRINYVLKFDIIRGRPARQSETIYINPVLVKIPPSEVDKLQGWNQAYAACKQKLW